MHKEFFKLPDGTTAITDNDGHLTVKENTNGDILMLENKLEYITKEVQILEEQERQYNDPKLKKADAIFFILSLVLSVLGSMFLVNFGQTIVSIGEWVVGAIIDGLGIAVLASFGIIYGDRYVRERRDKKGRKMELDKAKALKAEYEQEYQKKITNQNTHSDTYQLSPKVVSLAIPTDNALNEIDDALDDAYYKGYDQPKVKKITRKYNIKFK